MQMDSKWITNAYQMDPNGCKWIANGCIWIQMDTKWIPNGYKWIQMDSKWMQMDGSLGPFYPFESIWIHLNPFGSICYPFGIHLVSICYPFAIHLLSIWYPFGCIWPFHALLKTSKWIANGYQMDTKWIQMDPNGYQMDTKWIQFDPIECVCIHVVSIWYPFGIHLHHPFASKWIPNGSKWIPNGYQMDPNGSKWIQMDPNGSFNWIQLDPFAFKWLDF